MRDAADRTVTVQHYAWRVFAVLWALMVVDYVARQIIVPILPRMRSEWALSDTQLGGLVSIVPIIVALASMPLSFLADRWSAVKSILLMALVWNVATIASAFSTNYGEMLSTRGVVGLGEAAYGTAGAALVARLFPERVRATMLGVFLGAAVFGSVLGVMFGGIITERWGWRAAFGIAGVPGVILAILFWLLAAEYKALPSVSASGRVRPESGVVPQLLRTRTVLITCCAGGLQLLVVSATYAWLPSYLFRYYGLAAGEAGVKTGLVILIGGLGAILWSLVADRLTPSLACARLYVPAATAVVTAALLFGAYAWAPPGDYQLWLILACGLVMTGSIGPAAAVVIDVSPPGLHATAAAILALSQNLLGLAGGPFLTGVLADTYGLRVALSVVPVFALFAAIMFALAARTYLADVRNIELGEARVADSECKAI